MNIQEKLAILKKEIPPAVRLVAVSKTKSVIDILEAYQAGQKAFGENRAQELLQKDPLLPPDIEWHFIGHLQTNKVRTIAPFVDTIESIDRLKLLAEVNREAEKINRVIRCLLQFHIASEETKFGMDTDEAFALLRSPEFVTFRNIRVTGVMGMASLTCNQDLIRKEFRTLKDYFRRIREEFFPGDERFREISMGMSGDYRIAIEEGSTMVRIGTSIFGERNFP